MSIKITRPPQWYDHQTRYCNACSKNATLKIETRVEINDVEYGPAQTLKLCNEHLLELVDVLYQEVAVPRQRKLKWFSRSG